MLLKTKLFLASEVDFKAKVSFNLGLLLRIELVLQTIKVTIAYIAHTITLLPQILFQISLILKGISKGVLSPFVLLFILHHGSVGKSVVLGNLFVSIVFERLWHGGCRCMFLGFSNCAFVSMV